MNKQETVPRCPSVKQGRKCPCKKGNIHMNTLGFQKIVGYNKEEDCFEVRHNGILQPTGERVVLLAWHDKLYRRNYLLGLGLRDLIGTFERRFKKAMRSSFRVSEDGRTTYSPFSEDPKMKKSEKKKEPEPEPEKEPESESEIEESEVSQPGPSHFSDKESDDPITGQNDDDNDVNNNDEFYTTFPSEPETDPFRETIVISDDDDNVIPQDQEFVSDNDYESLDLYLDQVQPPISEENQPINDDNNVINVIVDDDIVPDPIPTADPVPTPDPVSVPVPAPVVRPPKISPMVLLGTLLNPTQGRTWNWFSYMPKGHNRFSPYDLRPRKPIRYY